MKKFSVLFGLTLTILYSCDKIDNPIPNLGTSINAGDGTEFVVDSAFGLTDSASIAQFISNNSWTTASGSDNSTSRFVVLEEFTGHTCTSCPKGTREITRLQGIFSEKLIPVGIHTGRFAEPKGGTSIKYTTDFRISDGMGNNDVSKVYFDRFKVDGNPRGIVSRVGGVVEPETAWEASINNIINDEPIASLALTNHHDSTNHVIRAEIDITWLKDSPEDYNLQLYVIEGKLFDWQLDGAFDDPNYEHKFVLRKIVNGLFGKKLKPVVVGESEKITYIFGVDSKWKGKNMEVVAFIFNGTNSNDDIIQANSAFLQ